MNENTMLAERLLLAKWSVMDCAAALKSTIVPAQQPTGAEGGSAQREGRSARGQEAQGQETREHGGRPGGSLILFAKRKKLGCDV